MTSRDKVLARVSRETGAKLDIYASELARWQQIKNLVGPATLADLWGRHIDDCLQLVDLAPSAARRWLDLGSGAGLPGLIVAIASPPGSHVHLVEANGRKCAFLRAAARACDASVTVHQGRLEDIVPDLAGVIEIVTARALAPLKELIGWCDPLWRRGAIGLLMKGQDVEAELTEASKSWKIQYELMASRSDPKGRIVKVLGVEPRLRPPSG